MEPQVIALFFSPIYHHAAKFIAVPEGGGGRVLDHDFKVGFSRLKVQGSGLKIVVSILRALNVSHC